MKVKVDADTCISCAVCTQLVPDVFEMNDDGIAEATVTDVPADLEEEVREAAEECPSDSILIEE